MTEQPDLLSWKPPQPYEAKGNTFSQERDGPRLNAQCLRVLRAFSDYAWHTLEDLEAKTGDPQASISARKRDLCRFGFKIEREYVGDGLWQYRLVANAA